MLPSIPAALDDAGAPDGSVAKKDAATVPVDSIVPVVIPLVLIDVDPSVNVPPIDALPVTANVDSVGFRLRKDDSSLTL